ncbi:MAG: flagellar hook-basal body complex protein FliE [Desulfobacterales bacterium]|nr:flagellar hook-basal body complex protein FliE [Desulfobacterales bacterium]
MSDLTIQPKMAPGVHQADKRSRGNSRGFIDVVKQAIKRVNDMDIAADESAGRLVKGQTGIHETLIAFQKADISLRLLLQIRNKALDAYREIMRMQF